MGLKHEYDYSNPVHCALALRAAHYYLMNELDFQGKSFWASRPLINASTMLVTAASNLSLSFKKK